MPTHTRRRKRLRRNQAVMRTIDSQSNIPFGIMGEQQFGSTKLKLKAGDMVLAYTDSLFESFDSNGEMLRADGIAEIANTISSDAPGDLVTTLLQRIQDLNAQNLASDDTTVILARANGERVSWKDDVLAPFRLLRGLFD